MLLSEVEEGEIIEGDELDFKWGNLKEKTSDDIQLYESFTLDGVEYCLYDCVYLQHEEESSVENHIGKIVKIMDHPDNQRKVKIVWFFRPSQVQNWLRQREVSCLVHELFLASGEGPGVENINPVEAIVGKCCVVCTSKDKRNPQPSIEERRKAEFVFSRTFDVKQCTFSHKLDNIISGIKVEHFFNTIEYAALSGDQEWKDAEVENPKSSGSQKDDLQAPIIQGGEDSTLKPKVELHHSGSLRSTSFEETASLGDSAKRSLDGEFNGNAMLVRKPKGGEDAKLKPKGESYHSSSLRSSSFEETASLGDSAKCSLDGEFKGNAMLLRKPKGGEDAKLKPKVELHHSGSLRNTSFEETASLGDSPKRSLDGEFNGNAMLVRKPKMKCKDSGMSSGFHVSHDRKIDRGTSTRVSPRKTVKLAGFHVSHDRKIDRGTSTRVSPRKTVKLAGFHVSHDRTYDRGTSSSVSLTKTGNLERKEFAPKPAGERGKKDVRVIGSKGPTKFVVRRAALDLAREKGRNTQTQFHSFREPGKDSVRHDRGSFTATTNDKKLHLNERREGARDLVRQDNWISRTLNRNDKRTLFSYKEEPETSQRKKMKSEGHTVEAQRNVDRSKWFNFKQLPSEEEVDSVDRAYSEGTLVRLQNLDPSYSAAEIEEIMLTYLNVRCTAKVLSLCTFSSPHNGQAFLIFNTEEKAAMVIKQLRERCLMLPNGRPLIAQRGVRKVLPEKSAKFFGHITLDRYRHREGKRAVSTSHCAQSNTVEYELALDWILQQRQSEATRKVLFELHGKELDALKAQLKNH
ncbi:hypothetical protein MKW98_030818 [Papaver atlanticum]|uniref:BAH domain-containing protein n=1 Tax=Papaver atlanticum TaxID=357466 RepID=A0AAD4X617_9MAGN|nr:hypothetical protein MKW98_030818 [Papaver atlanticum]